MLTLRTSEHIRTSRCLKSFRSLSHATSWIVRQRADLARVHLEETKRADREERRQWLAQHDK